MDDFPVDLKLTGENMQDANTPAICEGYLMKRRKWPLKGWHKVWEMNVSCNLFLNSCWYNSRTVSNLKLYFLTEILCLG